MSQHYKCIRPIFLSLFIPLAMQSQAVYFSFHNPQISPDSAHYEVDVRVSGDGEAFFMGAGQLYFLYNEAAFGPNAAANQRVEVLAPAGSILAGLTTAEEPVFTQRVLNDHATGRFSLAWVSGHSQGCLSGPNVEGQPQLFCRLLLKYVAGGLSQSPYICFEDAPPFEDQTATMCGPSNDCAPEDCLGFPPTLLVNDQFDCSATPSAAGEQPSAMQCRIYPNPATERIWVEFFSRKGGTAQWSLLSTQGQLLAQANWESLNGTNRFELPLSQEWRGQVLWLALETQEGRVTKPFFFKD